MWRVSRRVGCNERGDGVQRGQKRSEQRRRLKSDAGENAAGRGGNNILVRVDSQDIFREDPLGFLLRQRASGWRADDLYACVGYIVAAADTAEE